MSPKPITHPLMIVISRKQVEAGDINSILNILNRLIESPEMAMAHMEKVDIAFDGYNEISEELFEIPEVREFIHRLDEKFPYWLFFLSKDMLGLQCLMFCFLQPFLTDEAKARIHPQKLSELLLNRWGPALEHIAQFAGLDEEQVKTIALRSSFYFQKGRLT